MAAMSSIHPQTLHHITVGSEIYPPYYNLSSSFLRGTKCCLLQLLHDTSCITFHRRRPQPSLLPAVGACPLWKNPCKQQEAAVIEVPLDFTSPEAGELLKGNKGWTEGNGEEAGGMHCLYLAFRECLKACICSEHRIMSTQLSVSRLK